MDDNDGRQAIEIAVYMAHLFMQKEFSTPVSISNIFNKCIMKLHVFTLRKAEQHCGMIRGISKMHSAEMIVYGRILLRGWGSLLTLENLNSKLIWKIKKTGNHYSFTFYANQLFIYSNLTYMYNPD